ncbi:pectinesterase family protein [Saccharicrinis sp. FJH54]|uniref:pectinesterase family protein n=1 Tax=Saccharicrinis sp. FJH54 TaxID=3344665 RepID=UPI0035D4F780
MKNLGKILFIVLLFSSVATHAQTYDITVAKDGSGDFTSIREAIQSVRSYTPEPKTIFIKNGIYKEKILISSDKCDITLIGESRDNTIITWADHANMNNMGTFKTSTLRIDGDRITLKNLTIENNAPMLGQAVALHVEGKNLMVINCNLLGNQDTLFTGNEYGTEFFKDCYIEGTTDFIFGPATVWFENCHIHSKKNSYITAASTPEFRPYGYIFNKCMLTAAEGIDKVYLGRPWRKYAAVLFMNSYMGNHIRPEGWHNWGDPEREKTTRYLEYNNNGPGADRSQRVAWSGELKKSKAKKITLEKVFPDWEAVHDMD